MILSIIFTIIILFLIFLPTTLLIQTLVKYEDLMTFPLFIFLIMTSFIPLWNLVVLYRLERE